MPTGRFAPSPTGALHLGNLRTALLAWLLARRTGSGFVVRMEDLDRATSSQRNEHLQLRELAALGLDWDGPVLRQSERFDRYRAAIDELTARGLTYGCYCSRREIREAAAAPHENLPEGAYPGTCRSLTRAERARREAAGRPRALRLRAEAVTVRFHDVVHGTVTGVVDDFVLQRNDGVPAYNLAVVVDDAAQGVDEVVRGDDLLRSTPRQIHLAHLLGLRVPGYVHVPLVLAPDGTRLAKRHGAVTLEDLAERGVDAAAVRSLLAASVGLAEPGEPVTLDDLLARIDPGALPREPWVLDPATFGARRDEFARRLSSNE
jgi:glutamyl-tRNA synthetase